MVYDYHIALSSEISRHQDNFTGVCRFYRHSDRGPQVNAFVFTVRIIPINNPERVDDVSSKTRGVSIIKPPRHINRLISSVVGTIDDSFLAVGSRSWPPGIPRDSCLFESRCQDLYFFLITTDPQTVFVKSGDVLAWFCIQVNSDKNSSLCIRLVMLFKDENGGIYSCRGHPLRTDLKQDRKST